MNQMKMRAAVRPESGAPSGQPVVTDTASVALHCHCQGRTSSLAASVRLPVGLFEAASEVSFQTTDNALAGGSPAVVLALWHWRAPAAAPVVLLYVPCHWQ